MSSLAKQVIINNLLVSYYMNSSERTMPVLLFLHGWRSEGKVWQGIMNKLSGYPSYSLDLPGFGASAAPTQPWHLRDYADVVESFIKKFHLKNVVIIGHSFGGRVAIKLAARNPEYMHKVVLVDSAGIRAQSFARTLKVMAAKIVKPVFALPLVRRLRPGVYAMLGAQDYLATPELQKTFVNIIREDLTPLLPRIAKPVLLVWGQNDTDTPLTHARTMEQMIPGSQLTVIEAAGHFSFVDQPALFTEALQKFLSPHP